MDAGSYWENVWSSKQDDQVSWFEPYPQLSLGLVDEVLAGSTKACVLDVGGGTSMLTEVLLHDRGLEAQLLLDGWRIDYNTYRPHQSLGYLTSAEFARRWRKEHDVRVSHRVDQ